MCSYSVDTAAFANPLPRPAFLLVAGQLAGMRTYSRDRLIGKSIGCEAGDGAGHDGSNSALRLSVLKEVVGDG